MQLTLSVALQNSALSINLPFQLFISRRSLFGNLQSGFVFFPR